MSARSSRYGGAFKSAKPNPEFVAEKNIREALRPWADREAAGNHYWESKTEAEALRLADNIHRIARDNKNGLDDDDLLGLIRSELDLRGSGNVGEVKAFLKHAKKARKRNARDPHRSKHSAFGVPHTAGKEELWAALLTGSGMPTRMLNSGTGNPFVTDLESTINGVRKLVDVQNYYPRDGKPSMNLGVIKNIGTEQSAVRDKGLVQKVYRNSRASDTLGDLVGEIKSNSQLHGDGKLLATTDRRFNDKPDENMRDRADQFEVDYLIGGKYDRRKVNNLTDVTHGNYDPELPETNKIYDMSKVRESILSLPLGEYQRNGLRLSPSSSALGVQVPIETMDRLGGVNADDFLAQKVLQVMDNIRKNGLR